MDSISTCTETEDLLIAATAFVPGQEIAPSKLRMAFLLPIRQHRLDALHRSFDAHRTRVAFPWYLQHRVIIQGALQGICTYVSSNVD